MRDRARRGTTAAKQQELPHDPGQRSTCHRVSPLIIATAIFAPGLQTAVVDFLQPPATLVVRQPVRELRVDEDGDAELVGGPTRVDFLRAPKAKTVKNRLHLDLGSEDYDAAIKHAIASGAHPSR